MREKSYKPRNGYSCSAETARGGHDSGFTLRPDACITECKCLNRVQKRAVINKELETVPKM